MVKKWVNKITKLLSSGPEPGRYEKLAFAGWAQTLPNATPPIGKIHPFSKIAISSEPIMRF